MLAEAKNYSRTTPDEGQDVWRIGCATPLLQLFQNVRLTFIAEAAEPPAPVLCRSRLGLSINEWTSREPSARLNVPVRMDGDKQAAREVGLMIRQRRALSPHERSAPAA